MLHSEVNMKRWLCKQLLIFLKRMKIEWIVPDNIYLRMRYRLVFNRKLNIKNPTLYNEKIQWLKLNDHNPLYTKLVDKYEVKEYIRKALGEEYVIPTIGIWNSFEEIDFSKLPDQFVIKCTHDSASVVICKDKENFDIENAKRKIEKALKQNYYLFGREWAYKNVVPRIIIEKYMVDESGEELKDYKIYTFGGIPRLVQVDYARFTNHKRNIYDIQWNEMDVIFEYPTDSDVKFSKPKKLELMLEMAQKLAKDIPHVRIDFYSINEKIYFGEMTFYPECGFGKIRPIHFEYEMGNWIRLSKSKC